MRLTRMYKAALTSAPFAGVTSARSDGGVYKAATPRAKIPLTARRGEQGWIFVVVLILVTAASIIALAVTLAWVRYHRMLARQAEAQQLVELAEAFRSEVMESTTVAHPTNFVQAVRARLNKSETAITHNRQGNPRAFIEDPELGLGPSGNVKLPFTQSQAGSRLIRHPRLLILSSVGSPLPDDLFTGATLTPAEFSNIWNTPHGKVPSDWAWNGTPEDLLIQRVQLGDLFVSVTLRYYEDTPTHRGLYLISSDPVSTNLPSLLPSTPFTNSFLRGTYLSLYGTNGVLQFREILQESGVTYTCQNGIWRLGQGARGSRMGPVIRHPTPDEFADLITAFLDPDVPLWPQSEGITKQDLVAAITNFLATGAYNNDGPEMDEAQSALIDAWVALTGAQPNKP